MSALSEALQLLREQHDENQKAAYDMLISGDEMNREVYSYGSGMLHAIRTIEDATGGR